MQKGKQGSDGSVTAKVHVWNVVVFRIMTLMESGRTITVVVRAKEIIGSRELRRLENCVEESEREKERK